MTESSEKVNSSGFPRLGEAKGSRPVGAVGCLVKLALLLTLALGVSGCGAIVALVLEHLWRH